MKTVSPHAQIAKVIRKEIKKLFPSIKVKVKGDIFAMGSAVNIILDEPTKELIIKIKEAFSKYEGENDLGASIDYLNVY